MRIVVDAMGEAGARKDALQGGPAASPQRAWNGSIGELGGAGKRVEGASRTTGAKVAPTPPPGYLVLMLRRGSGRAWIGRRLAVMVRDKNQTITKSLSFLCAPDTVDPRGPKGK